MSIEAAVAAPTIAHLLAERARDRGTQPLLVTESATLTYADVADQASATRATLAERGIVAGDRIALIARNCDEYLGAAIGVLGSGAILVPTNPDLRPRELEYVLTQSGTRATLVEAETAPAVAEAGGDRLDLMLTVEEATGASTRAELALLSNRDPAAIMYTSGTTADPKGVIVPHAGYCLAPAMRAEHLGWTDAERVLVVYPLFHVNALVQSCFACIAAGGTVILRRKFSASRFWDDARAHEVTTLCGMQTIPRILVSREERPDDRDNPVRTLVGALPPGLFERFEERFGVLLIGAYSLTEDTMSVVNFADERRKKESAGVAIAPHMNELRIVDDEGRPLPPGTAGEIVKRSPATMLGYWEKPEETAAALRDGWLHTGDVGVLDDDGFLTFVDRKKDVVHRGGELISSMEVEMVLATHPAVAEAAVVPLPDEILGERVRAVIVPIEGLESSEELAGQLFELCSRDLAKFKVPSVIEFRDDLPRTPNMKVRKLDLRTEGVTGLSFQAAEVKDRAPAQQPS